jgi:hypothetical protein
VFYKSVRGLLEFSVFISINPRYPSKEPGRARDRPT